MNKKTFIILILLLAFIGVKDVKALTLDDTLICQKKYDSSIPYANYFYSIKQNKIYPITCPSGASNITVGEAIENNLLEGEMDNVDSLSIFTWDYSHYFDYILAPIPQDAKQLLHDGYGDIISNGTIIEKGTVFIAPYIVVNGNTLPIFYADKNYVVTNSYGSHYSTYYYLEVAPNQPEEHDSEEHSNLNNNHKLDLECQNNNEVSHLCKLYYIYQKTENNPTHEISFKLIFNNLKGHIIINDKKEIISNDKEYKAELKCDEEDNDTCKVLVARLETENLNSTNDSSIEIAPISLKIDDETYTLGVENNKCTYPKVVENPKTSTYHILFVIIILIMFGRMLIVLKKNKMLTKI